MKKMILICLLISGVLLVNVADAKTRTSPVRPAAPKKSYDTLISKLDYEQSVDLDHDGHTEKVSIIERVRTGAVQLWITDRFGIVTMINLDIPKVDLVILSVTYEDLLGNGTEQIFLTTSHGFHGKADVTEKQLTIIALSKDGNNYRQDEVYRQKLEFYSKEVISKSGEHQVWKVLLVHTKNPLAETPARLKGTGPSQVVPMKIRDVKFPAKE